MDPSIEWNPGPSQFMTVGEKALFNAIKDNNKELARLASHRFFLVSCRDLGIVPRSLDLKVPVAVAHGTYELQHAIKNITDKKSPEVMD